MWLTVLLEQVTGFIPRPIIVRPDEGGFRQIPKFWGRGTWLREMKAGNWYWLVPWFMQHEVIKTKPQIVDIRIQSVWTKDGRDIAIGGAIKYYVSNSMKAQLSVLDYDKMIQNIALVKIFSFVRKHTFDEIKDSIEELCKELLELIREDSKGWGLKVQEVELTDIGTTQNFRILLSGDLINLGTDV